MGINSIEWHEQNLKNWKISNDKQREHLKEEEEFFKESEKRLRFFEYQVKCAKIEGKIKFDRERYKIKLKKRK